MAAISYRQRGGPSRVGSSQIYRRDVSKQSVSSMQELSQDPVVESLLDAISRTDEDSRSMFNDAEAASVTGLRAAATITKKSDKLSNFADTAMSIVRDFNPSAQFAMVQLATVELSRKLWIILKNWWIGKISGKKCAKKCASEFVKTGGLVGGAIAGALVGGTLMGPVGGVTLGVVGATLGKKAGKSLAKLLGYILFGESKIETVENAYKFLGVGPKATNEEINTAYRRKARIYHPDREGGDVEKFHQLQICLGLIKLERGEGTCAEAEGKIRGAICY